jgi:membrane associated rhomboid family serine protease
MQLRITPAVKWLLIACVGMFLVQQTGDRFLGTQVLNYLALVPAHFVIDLWLWQIVTYSFLHGDVMHLFLNMLMLVFIGGEIESLWGTRRFLRFYFFCVVVGGLFYLAMQAVQGGLGAPMVGASGGIYGLLMAYGLL